MTCENSTFNIQAAVDQDAVQKTTMNGWPKCSQALSELHTVVHTGQEELHLLTFYCLSYRQLVPEVLQGFPQVLYKTLHRMHIKEHMQEKQGIVNFKQQVRKSVMSP